MRYPARGEAVARDDTWTDEVERDPPSEATVRTRRFGERGEIGRGGLGLVDALHDRTLGRDVARKTLLAEGRVARQRFLREAQITARLEHPGVVPIHDLGEGPDGRPFYLMRRIRGRTLAQAVADAPGLSGRLALIPRFEAICQTMAFAHAQGIVHRDLKPDNLMIGEYGEALVVDWGIAREIGPAEDDPDGTEVTDAGLTQGGAAIGTPAYMSPEQARGERVDARSDVWGLGAVLFFLLAGRRPFGGRDTHDIVVGLRDGHFDDLGALAGAPPELVAIVAKATAPRADDRYADASAIAADIGRWRDGAMVGAYAYTPLERLTRQLRRHVAAITGVAAAALALVGVGVAATVAVGAQRDRAVAAEQVAEAERNEARGRLARSLAEAADDALASDDPTAAWVLAAGSLAIQESAAARGLLLAADERPRPRRLGSRGLRCQALAVRGADVLCVSGRRLVRTGPGGEVTADVPGEGQIDAATPGPGGFLVTDGGGLWGWNQGSDPVQLGGHAAFNAAVGGPDGAVFVATDDGRLGRLAPDGAITWATQRSLVSFDTLAPLADGRVVVGDKTGPAGVWDPRDDRFDALPGDPRGSDVAASADGGVILVGGAWSGAAAPVVLVDHGRAVPLGEATVAAVAVSADGGRVVIAERQRVVIRDAPDWAVTATIPTDDAIVAIAIPPDGGEVHVADSGGDLRRWGLPARAPTRPRARGAVWDVRPLDGDRLVSAADDGVLRVWRADGGGQLAAWPLDPGGLGMVAPVDGGDVIVGTNDGALWRVDPDDGAVRWRVRFDGVINDLQALGGQIWVATYEGEVAALGPDGGLRWRKRLGGDAVSIAAAQGGVIVGVDDVAVRIDGAGEERARVPLHGLVHGVVPLADGGFAAAQDDRAVITDPRGVVTHELPGHAGRVIGVTAADHLVATGGDDGRLCLWPTGGPPGRVTPVACLPAHTGTIWRTLLLADAVVTAGGDGRVRRVPLARLHVDPAALLHEAARDLGLAPGDGVVTEVP